MMNYAVDTVNASGVIFNIILIKHRNGWTTICTGCACAQRTISTFHTHTCTQMICKSFLKFQMKENLPLSIRCALTEDAKTCLLINFGCSASYVFSSSIALINSAIISYCPAMTLSCSLIFSEISTHSHCNLSFEYS